MKRPIEWHEQTLVNQVIYLEQLKKALEKQQNEVKIFDLSVAFYESQILKAKQAGKDGFDSEKFMIPKQRNKDRL